MKKTDVNLLSPSVLAFVGDSVYSLAVRSALATVNRPSGELHRLSVEAVNANAQAAAFETVKPYLTEQELAVFKRGRNFHTSTTPKSASHAVYHTATGLECIFGYLYLCDEQARIQELFHLISSASFSQDKTDVLP